MARFSFSYTAFTYGAFRERNFIVLSVVAVFFIDVYIMTLKNKVDLMQVEADKDEVALNLKNPVY